jgi:hypothetical protein
MPRVLVLSFGCLLLLGSCTQKLICPAYESSFIYDQEELRKKFSYFKDDSTPKVVTVSKNKYLIIPEQAYRKKIRSLKTIEMKPVMVQLPDSLKPDYQKGKDKKNDFKGAEQDRSDSAVIKKIGIPDSTSDNKHGSEEDSVYVITKDKEARVLKYDRDSSKYKVVNITLNADQDNYMWYFRDVLVLPDVRAALEDQQNAKAQKEKDAKIKKRSTGFFGFFRNLFKKKQKTDSTKSLVPTVPPIDSENPADSTAALSAAAVKPPPPPEKKGFFSFLKRKKSKAPKKEPEPVIDPAQKPADKKEPDKKEPVKKEDGF